MTTKPTIYLSISEDIRVYIVDKYIGYDEILMSFERLNEGKCFTHEYSDIVYKHDTFSLIRTATLVSQSSPIMRLFNNLSYDRRK